MISSISPLENATTRFVPKSSAGGVLNLKSILVFSAYSCITSIYSEAGDCAVSETVIDVVRVTSTIGNSSLFTSTSDSFFADFSSFEEHAVIKLNINTIENNITKFLFIIDPFPFLLTLSIIFQYMYLLPPYFDTSL